MPRPGGRAFNRTIIELKQSPPAYARIFVTPFNRTIIELKPSFGRGELRDTSKLLIGLS